MATPQDLLSALASAYSFAETRAGGDPEYVEAMERVREIQGKIGWLVVRVGPEGLTAGGEVIQDLYGDCGPFQAVLEGAGIQELRFQEALEPEVLEEFFVRLHPSSATEGTLPSARFRGMEEAVGLSFREPQAALPGMVGGVQDLFQSPVAGSQDSAGGPAEWSQAASESKSAAESTNSSSSSSRALSPELVEEVRVYVDSSDLHREESGKRLRDGAARLAQSRNATALGELVQLLAESAGSESGDQGAAEMAREFTTPAVASHIVARLGAARDPAERGRLARVISLSGREGALALADALGESRDRSERRNFLDAMVTLGPLALEMAQRLMGDPRWFVVRNGVAVLGELGGEDAVAHLTVTLANGDSRVRKETILSLAKIGGGDAGMLILGMLDDGDAQVRASACKALGTIRSHRAFRLLLQRLKDDDHEVQVEAIQALGRIGDPGAVQFIEKKAMGGLFSRLFRPPQEVRIAAFRALANIGTARSLTILEKGAKDKDSSVRTVARALLEGV